MVGNYYQGSLNDTTTAVYYLNNFDNLLRSYGEYCRRERELMVSISLQIGRREMGGREREGGRWEGGRGGWQSHGESEGVGREGEQVGVGGEGSIETCTLLLFSHFVHLDGSQ